MSKHLGDDLGVDVAGEEQSSARVPEVVEAGGGGEASIFKEPSKGAVSKVGGVDNATNLVSED